MISSENNAKIKQIRKLTAKKERDRTGLFYAEGIRIVAEAAQNHAIHSLIVSPDLLTSDFARQVVEEQRSNDVLCIEVTPHVMRSMSSRERPQGLAAVVRQRWESLAAVRLADELCWVALAAPQDPGNVGTILRTSEAVGGAGVILIGDSTDPYHPAAVRASMGAICTQRLVRTTCAAFVRWQRAHNYRVIGTSLRATHDYDAVSYRPPLVLLMGSERQGLSASEAAACALTVRIPMVGRADSLNLAVATGIVLYEAFRQRRARQ